MNFYAFHIGDYLAHTAHLDPLEDLAYRRMIDLYYTREGELPPSPLDIAKLIRMRDHLEIVESTLNEFFEKTETGWANKRCDYEIDEAKSKRTKARESAAQRWNNERKADAMRSHEEGNAPNPNPNPNPSRSKTIGAYPEEFEAAWDAYPSRPGSSKKDAFKAWAARLSAGVSADLILDGVKRYSAYCRASCTDPKYIKQPATFFGPNEHYLSDWTIPQQARASPPRTSGRNDAISNYAAQAAAARGEGNGNRNERDITGESIRIG